MSISGNGAERVITYETEKVQPPVGVFGVLETREDRLVFVKLALLDLNVDPDDILPHDTPRTDIQMSVLPRSIRQKMEPSGRKRGMDNGETNPTSEFPMSPSESPTASP